jgi:hypothetical protein
LSLFLNITTLNCKRTRQIFTLFKHILITLSGLTDKVCTTVSKDKNTILGVVYGRELRSLTPTEEHSLKTARRDEYVDLEIRNNWAVECVMRRVIICASPQIVGY